MDLVDENRIFVKQGLEMLKRTQNEGLKALMECTQVPTERLSAYHIGFVIGPCINASGRLDTAKRALELLEVKNRREAVMMAEDLKALNDSRKEMTEKGVEQAVEQIETTDLKEDRVLVVYLPDCHESIAGIIAGRLKEKYYKPVFVLTQENMASKGRGVPLKATICLRKCANAGRYSQNSEAISWRQGYLWKRRMWNVSAERSMNSVS